MLEKSLFDCLSIYIIENEQLSMQKEYIESNWIIKHKLTENSKE